MDFCQLASHLWPINSPCSQTPTPVSYSDDSGYDCQWIFLAVKKRK